MWNHITNTSIQCLLASIYRETTIRPMVYDLEDEEGKRVLVIGVPSRPIGKVFKFEDVPLMRVGEDLKPMSDAVYLKILQESEPDFSEKICEGLTLDALDEKAFAKMMSHYADKWHKPEFSEPHFLLVDSVWNYVNQPAAIPCEHHPDEC